MSDENVGGLVAKWRGMADENRRKPFRTASEVVMCDTLNDCADELEAALSAHGGLLFTQGDMERFAGYVADAREERLKSAHGQPVVDEAMVDRAMYVLTSQHYANTLVIFRDRLRAALTAALTGADHK